jgi:hypothetical protein
VDQRRAPGRPLHDEPDLAEMTADQWEQRQRLDGGLDDAGAAGITSPEWVDPDVVEQHRGRDGALEEPELVVDPSDGPLTADEIEQRRFIDDDDEDQSRTP